jgi:hypothetical protein
MIQSLASSFGYIVEQDFYIGRIDQFAVIELQSDGHGTSAGTNTGQSAALHPNQETATIKGFAVALITEGFAIADRLLPG